MLTLTSYDYLSLDRDIKKTTSSKMFIMCNIYWFLEYCWNCFVSFFLKIKYFRSSLSWYLYITLISISDGMYILCGACILCCNRRPYTTLYCSTCLKRNSPCKTFYIRWTTIFGVKCANGKVNYMVVHNNECIMLPTFF